MTPELQIVGLALGVSWTAIGFLAYMIYTNKPRAKVIRPKPEIVYVNAFSRELALENKNLTSKVYGLEVKLDKSQAVIKTQEQELAKLKEELNVIFKIQNKYKGAINDNR